MYTEEARKQRNRDAQAAFRERRIEYIKELEEKVKAYSARLRALEAKRTEGADECLMLRYKNSLLERILVHKGMCGFRSKRESRDFRTQAGMEEGMERGDSAIQLSFC